MPNKCCVPNCKGNYKTGPKLSIFSFPNDPELRRKWLKAICRDNFIPTKYTKVCELHFKDGDIERVVSLYDEKTGQEVSAPLSYPRLKPGAVPSKMPGCPGYLSQASTSSPREPPEVWRSRLENESLRVALEKSNETLEAYNNAKQFTSFQELKAKVRGLSFPENWVLIERETVINIALIEDTPLPKLQCAVQINAELVLSACLSNTEIHNLPSLRLPKELTNTNEIESIVYEMNKISLHTNNDSVSVHHCTEVVINFLDNLGEMLTHCKRYIAFLKEQVSILPVHKTRNRYSWDTLIFCSLLYSISPHAYKFLRSSNMLKLPDPSTLRRVCSKFSTSPQFEQDTSNLLSYVSSKFSMLALEDKTVLLLIDEIHLKACLDYKGGTVVGSTFHNEECATTAYTFMISSMMSDYKEVAHILPVKTISGEELHRFLNDIIFGLENIGYEVLAVVSDNHTVNKKAMSLFSTPPVVKPIYDHPKGGNRILYFVIDSVRILKCIRNNWLNCANQDFLFPNFNNVTCTLPETASFGALKEMHSSEKQNLVQYGFTLSLKALYPSSIERQNVKLALKIFNSSTAEALRELGCVHHYRNWESTSNFIDIICKWWDIVNVKTPLKGQRLRNNFQEPMTQQSHHITEFLNAFLEWLERWKNFNSSGMLSRETHSALKHTTEALMHMSKYWTSERGHSYFLCGKVQTDNLEDRFGQYRQLSGAQYHVSVRQIYESEHKLRLQNVIPLVLKSHNFGEVAISTSTELSDTSSFFSGPVHDTAVPDILKNTCGVEDDDIDNIQESMWPLLTYIGGYNSYMVMKKLKCEYCKQFLISDKHDKDDILINASNRGGLCYPHRDVVNCVASTYLTVQKLISKDVENVFLKQINKRNIVISLGLSNAPQNVFEGHSCHHHNIKDIIKQILFITANILLNNYTKRKNDTLKNKSMPALKRHKV